jgi:hypothetical protein
LRAPALWHLRSFAHSRMYAGWPTSHQFGTVCGYKTLICPPPLFPIPTQPPYFAVLAPHPDPKVMSLPRDEEEEKRSCRILFSEGLATALFRSSLLHPFESVRSAALSLGLRIFPPIKTVDRPIACKCLLVQANVLVSSANPRIADAGSGIVELLYSK